MRRRRTIFYHLHLVNKKQAKFLQSIYYAKVPALLALRLSKLYSIGLTVLFGKTKVIVPASRSCNKMTNIKRPHRVVLQRM